MNFGIARKYFTDRAKDLKYKKHYDGFATDNIPSTKFDKAFHVEAFTFNTGTRDQYQIEFLVPVTVRLFFKGYRDVDETIEVATIAGENYIAAALASENRLAQQVLKNVLFDSMVVEPYASSNDNSVVCRMEFTAVLYKGNC